MPGASAMLEVKVWVQLTCPATVMMKYWPEGEPGNMSFSQAVQTSHAHANTAHLVADNVQPGKRYQYELFVDNQKVPLDVPVYFRTQNLWQYRTPPADFKFAAGSCTYINEPQYDRPGPPYGGGYEIFESIRGEQPDFMVWLGDNIYLREVDWNSRTGIYHRYSHLRSQPELRGLLSSTHHYATWDDHDYGPNDSDRHYWGKEWTLEAFKDFWANPNYGVGGTEGITGTFFWEDCQFFVLDNRWYRAPQPGPDYFGAAQLQWLIDGLRYSRASYKFICTGGQILSDAALYENYAVFDAERQMLLDSLDKYNIKGVIFLTGDRHHSEVTRMTTADGDVFVDITSSALTSSTYDHSSEPNTLRVPGSIFGIRNYAMIEVNGPRNARTCTVTFKDGIGGMLYTLTLNHARTWTE